MISINKLIQNIAGTTPPILNWLAGHRGSCFQGARVILVDGASLAIDCSLGETFQITCASDAIRVFAAPTNLRTGAIFQTRIINTSGAGLTQTTFAAAYKAPAPTTPATGNNRFQTWFWDGTNAFLVSQTAADNTN